jgi:biopolymer transport protein ExbD
MKRVTLAADNESGIDVNMSPLIDCVFLLLIFFIVTTVFVEETGVDVNRPQAVSAVRLDRQSIMIALTPEGTIVYGGRTIPLDSVRGLVARQLRERDVPVIILADRDSRTGLLVEVMDECKLGGAKHVSVAAGRKEP